MFIICFSIMVYFAVLICTYLVLNCLPDHQLYQIEQTLYPSSPLFYYTNELTIKLIPAVAFLLAVWLVLAYFWGAEMFIGKANATEITLANDRRLYRLVENLCVTRGLPTPKIYVMQDSALNAFATGRNAEHAIIALTSGLLEALDKSELQGVVAHELAHIENRDITLMLLAIEGVAFFTFFGEALLKIPKEVGGGMQTSNNPLINGGGMVFGFLMGFLISFILVVIGFILTLFGYLIAPVLRFAVSRQREFLADATSALTTRNPGALAKALEKISQNSRTAVLRRHPSMAAMCIDSPHDIETSLFNRISGLYASHPPISERIKKLRKMDGTL